MSYDVYDIPEAARKVGVSSRTIQRRLESGKLPGAFKKGGRWAIPEPTLASSFPNAFPPKHDKDDTEDDNVNDTKSDNYDSLDSAVISADSQLIKHLQDELERTRTRADRLENDLREERAASRETAKELARLADQAQQLELAHKMLPASLSAEQPDTSDIKGSHQPTKGWTRFFTKR